MAQLILRKAAKSTGVLKTVTCMTLRHTFAVHCLENGDSIRAVQEALGHESIDTTLIYEDCILPRGVISPLSALRKYQRDQKAEEDMLRSAPSGSGHPSKSLFEQPLSVDALELPFREDSSVGFARNFYRLLKTHIIGRFLGKRRATIRAG